jgi:superoxide reductase
MAERLGIYKCETCGNIIEVMRASKISVKCCGSRMVLEVENMVDAAKEKHVPVFEKKDGGIFVKVGDVAHPMEDNHYIQWIEVLAGNKVYKEFLSPGKAPEAFFNIDANDITVRAYCNLHGHWKA